jgi:hypothetical protein
MHEHGVNGQPVQDRRVGERRQAPRRRASGPRPVRPAVNAVTVRPAEVERPQASRSRARRVPLPVAGMRTLARRPLATPQGAVALARLRRVLAGLVVAVVAGALVVGLGLLADAAAVTRAGEQAGRAPHAPVVVTVGAERSPWDVARRVAPGASGPELAALAERIVTDNSLGPVPLHPGQVLRVTSG